jgi:hypothetical protein
VGSRVEGNCGAVFYVESRSKRRKYIRDCILVGGDANRLRIAFETDLGARDRRKTA